MDKEFRIRKNKEFADIIKQKKSIRTDTFIIYYTKNISNHFRFGLSVSKKVGNAVTRNKIKRQLRAIINNNKKIQKCCYDIVVIVKENFVKNSYQKNKELFDYNIEQIL